MPPVVVGLGEVLWDIFPTGRHTGGAPANVAYHANQLGCRGIVASRVGTDPLGDELLAALSERGLAVDHIQRDAAHPTGTVTARTNTTGGVDYTIHTDVAWDFLAGTEALLTLMRSADGVCFGSLAQRSPVSREAVRQAVAATRPDCLRVYDVNLRQSYFDRDVVEWSIRHARVIKVNHEEVPVIAGLVGRPVDSALPFAEQAEAFHRVLAAEYGIDQTIVTRAAEGCLVLSGEEAMAVPGQRIEKPDPVGAGDAFTAAYLYARLHGWPLARAATFANRVGTLVASLPGAMPAVADAYKTLIAELAP